MSDCCCYDSKDRMITIEELSKYIKISIPMLYKGVREQSLGIPYIRINKAVRFLKSDVDAWIDMHRENTGPRVVALLKDKPGEGSRGNANENYAI